MSTYILEVEGTWTKDDNSEVSINTEMRINADSTAELKIKFKERLQKQAFKRGYKSVTGTITSVKRISETQVATNREFSGSFVNTENVSIVL